MTRQVVEDVGGAVVLCGLLYVVWLICFVIL